MGVLTREKLDQAGALVAASGVDAWITFDRETAQGGDPVLPLILEGGLTWQSALLVLPQGQRIAIVGSYDAPALEASGDWGEVLPYVQTIREPLLQALERTLPQKGKVPRIAVNFSISDDKADGLSHGMYLQLEEYLRGTRFEGSLVSSEEIVSILRSQKTPAEIARIRAAVAETGSLFEEIGSLARVGTSEREIYDFVQRRMEERGLGYSWDRTGDPIVNTGPESMIGHGIPSPDLRIAPGHILHIDLGVVRDGYSSDIQRCWYVPKAGETDLPDDVRRAQDAVNGAITAGSQVLRPGMAGWQVDEPARRFVQAAGYPEYMHSLGHQVGRMAHDGGAILGPRWERYGRTPFLLVQRDQVYTLELGVLVEGRGYLGCEEMIRVNDDGCEWLTQRQLELPFLTSG